MNLKFSKLFDWSIKAVDTPKHFFDEKRKIEAFLVKVTYNYHGVKKVLFYIDELMFVNVDTPRWKAERYYDKMINKMQNQKQK